MDIIDQPSPNFDDRGRPIDLLILHYTGMKSGAEALERLCDPNAKVSSHYLVEEDGRIFQLVDETKRAWHAGISSWKGSTDINARSIGIEIVNPGHEWGYRAFPRTQITSVVELVEAVCHRHSIAPTCVLGHADIAPGRKEDPGELFPWDMLASQGLAVGPYSGPGNSDIDYFAALDAIERIGYAVEKNAHAAAVLAFQRRFCPSDLGQGLSPLTKAAALWAAATFAP
ncbi:MAG: N-acetylmuramoyl-L-alanine amidase [Pseudomonadota bacterium]